MIVSLSIFLLLHSLILNVQISIPILVKTQICTLFSVQTVTALPFSKAETLYFNSEFLRLIACKNLSNLPRTPTSGIFQTAAGTTSWDSQPGMVLMPPPIASNCGWTEVSLSPTQVIAHRLPHRFWELLFIARCAIWLCGAEFFVNLFLRLTRWANRLGYSSEFRRLLPHTSWRSEDLRLTAAHNAPLWKWSLRRRVKSFRFLLVRQHRGRYLKYCYSIVKELESGIYPLIIFGNEQGGLDQSFLQKILIFLYFHISCTKNSPAVGRQGKGCNFFLAAVYRALREMHFFR